MSDSKFATLYLEDGSSFTGFAFGAAGDVVFQTGMVGYPESLTDPSYKSQILVLTYPLIENNGVPGYMKDEFNLLEWFESERIYVAALIVGGYTNEYSHWNAKQSLHDWLVEQGIPAIYGIDTRVLMKRIRGKGTMLGKIISAGMDVSAVEFYDPNQHNLVAQVSVKEPRVFNESGDVRVLVVDCGLKFNQIRCLCRRGARVKVVPWNHPISSEDYDGLFVSNGPGDPKMCVDTIANLRHVLNADNVKPIFGICLGHQLMALAAGAMSYKLKYGNRSLNQPCTHIGTQRCFITTQNHGFAIDAGTLSSDWSELFVNENDGSNEGLMNQSKPVFSVQFHPEHMAGPTDLEILFDVFLDHVREKKTALSGCVSAKDRLQTLLTYVPKDDSIKPLVGIPKKVLILGSGGLSIEQAGNLTIAGHKHHAVGVGTDQLMTRWVLLVILSCFTQAYASKEGQGQHATGPGPCEVRLGWSEAFAFMSMIPVVLLWDHFSGIVAVKYANNHQDEFQYNSTCFFFHCLAVLALFLMFVADGGMSLSVSSWLLSGYTCPRFLYTAVFIVVPLSVVRQAFLLISYRSIDGWILEIVKTGVELLPLYLFRVNLRIVFLMTIGTNNACNVAVYWCRACYCITNFPVPHPILRVLLAVALWIRLMSIPIFALCCHLCITWSDLSPEQIYLATGGYITLITLNVVLGVWNVRQLFGC